MSVLSFLAKILFVGHSLVGPDLPPMLQAGLEAAGQPAEVQAQIINGAPLVWNWDKSDQAEGVDARKRLAEGGIDDLILTEAQPLADQVQWNDTPGLVARWADAARAANPQARVWLYQTWPAFGQGGTAAWRAQLAKDAPLWQGSAGAHARLIPAGDAMAALEDRIAAGAVPGLTDITQLFSDDIHLNGRGRYLVAMVHIAALTSKSPEGLPAKLTRVWDTREDVVTPEQAAEFQRIAWQVVQAQGAEGAQGAASPPGMKSVPARAAKTPDPKAAVPKAAVPQTLAVKDTAPKDFARVQNPALGLGLAGISDWSPELPFIDLMKTARPWIGHLPGQWGGWDEAALRKAGALDPQGWPTSIPQPLTGIATLVLTDLPEETGGVAGRYLLRHQGKGRLTLGGRAAVVDQAPGRITFDYAPGPGSVIITIEATEADDPIRAITLTREDRAEALDRGELFNPDWLARIRGVKLLRFMDWMATNNSTLARAEDRPRPADYTWARAGVPIEVIVALANQLRADPWVNVPHLAEDALAADLASVVARDLEPGLKVWVEYSNEIWNWQFTQATWADAQALDYWGAADSWVAFGALRAAEVMTFWSDRLTPDRLVRVIGTQTGWKGLEEQILAPKLVTDEGLPAPYKGFDAYAVTGYVSGQIGTPESGAMLQGWLAESRKAAEDAALAQGLSGAEAEAFVQAHRFDLAVERAAAQIRDGSLSGVDTDSLAQMRDQIFPYHAKVARDHGLRLVMYEGGTHVTAQGALIDQEEVTAFFAALNYSPQMGQIYQDLIAAWHAQSDAPFNAYLDVMTPGKWGSWGGLRHLEDDNPRWQALIAAPGDAAGKATP